jgi:uncharacterized protein
MKTFFLLMSVFVTSLSGMAQSKVDKKEKLHYIYVLSLSHKFKKEKNWTEVQNQTMCAMIDYLEKLSSEGTVHLAGRTDYAYGHPSNFGIVLLEVNSEEDAKSIMMNDPAVKSKLMSATLHPINIPIADKQLLRVR